MNDGDIVYFAKDYRDPLPGSNILVKGEGTFYFNQIPPKGVNYVTGRLSRVRGNGVSIGIYDYFMNFNSAEVWNCHNDQPVSGAQIEKNFRSCIDSNTIVCNSFEEASILSNKCHEQGISCVIQGRMLINVSNPTAAREILELMNPKGRCIYQALPTEGEINEDEIEDNFEI